MNESKVRVFMVVIFGKIVILLEPGAVFPDRTVQAECILLKS